MTEASNKSLYFSQRVDFRTAMMSHRVEERMHLHLPRHRLSVTQGRFYYPGAFVKLLGEY